MAGIDAMRASRSILAAEHSPRLRPYPSGAQVASHHQQLRDETQRRLSELNFVLDRALARHQPFNPLDHEQTK